MPNLWEFFVYHKIKLLFKGSLSHDVWFMFFYFCRNTGVAQSSQCKAGLEDFQEKMLPTPDQVSHHSVKKLEI